MGGAVRGAALGLIKTSLFFSLTHTLLSLFLTLSHSHTLSLTHRDAAALDAQCILMEGSVLTIHPRLQIENSQQDETVNSLTLKPEAPSRDAVAARRAVHHAQRNDAVGTLDSKSNTVNGEP